MGVKKGKKRRREGDRKGHREREGGREKERG